MPPKKLGRPPGSTKKSKMPIKQEIIDNNVQNDIDDIDIKSSDRDLSMRVIEKKIIFNCKRCPNKNFKFEKSYRDHLLLEHSTIPGSLPCSQCQAVCPSREILDDHIMKVHRRSMFTCAYCGKEFARQAHVLRHMAQKGCDGSGAASYPCEICSATFTRKDNLIVHLRHMHIKKMLYRCKWENCDFASKNLTKLIRHWHSTHADVPNRFECDHCGKSTMSRAAITKHLEIHGEKKYSCDVCAYSTYTIEVMRRHILTHVDEKPYKCNICNSSYIQRAQLDRHMDKHCTEDCDVCGEKITCKARMLLHRKRHFGFDEMTCPFKNCSDTSEFPTENMLIKHIQIHLQHKETWMCEVCKKRFSSEMNMRRHLSTHTLDRPRRCMYCVSARAYVRGQQLVRHVRKFHSNVFITHLAHVRNVLVANPKSERVTKSELESILTLLDAESERILEGYSGENVLYGGMQMETTQDEEEEDSPLMSEEVLAENLNNLLVQLIDKDTLQYLGWPDEPIDDILEKVILQCGAKPADREMWSRVQRLRENAKHLFLYVVDDKNVAMMLGTHTIDQIIKHILAQADNDDIKMSDQDMKGPEMDHGNEIEIEIPVS